MNIVHVSYPKMLMFGATQVGRSRGRTPLGKQEGWGGRQAPQLSSFVSTSSSPPSSAPPSPDKKVSTSVPDTTICVLFASWLGRGTKRNLKYQINSLFSCPMFSRRGNPARIDFSADLCRAGAGFSADSGLATRGALRSCYMKTTTICAERASTWNIERDDQWGSPVIVFQVCFVSIP